MMPPEQTAYIAAILKERKDVVNIVSRFEAVENYAQFQVLSDVCGYHDEFPLDVLMLFMACSPRHCTGGDKRAGAVLDIIYEALGKTRMLDKAVTSKTFINLCGRWCAKRFAQKDKTIYLKLSKIVGYVAEHLMHL